MSAQLILVDLSAILHRNWHLSTTEANPDATSTKTVADVRAYASGQPHVAICIDSATSWRKQQEPTYKANRERNEPLQHQMRVAIDILKADGFPVWGADGFEADDIIASAVDALGRFELVDGVVRHFVIVSADKDLLQLVGAGVSFKSLLSGDVLDRDAVKTAKTPKGALKFGVWPEQIVDWLSLVGDNSDNIIGCEKVGPVTATALLGEFGTLDGLYAAFDKGATPTLTPNLRTRLQDFRPRLESVRSLIRLRTDVPIPFDEIFKERVPQHDVAVFGDAPEPLGPDSFGGEDYPSEISQETRDMIRDMTNGDTVNTETGEVIDDMAWLGTPADKATKPSVADAMAGATTKGVMPSDRKASSERPAGRNAEATSESATTGVGTSTTPAPVYSIAKPEWPLSRETDGDRLARDLETQRKGMTSTALVPAVVDYERQLEPRSIEGAFKLAQSMFQARLFSAYGNEHAVLATILAGREFGMPAIASLRAFHIVEGKPTLAADTIRAIVLRSGAAEYFRCTERTPTRATFVTKRRGEPEMALSFTIEEGRQAWPKDESAWLKSGWGKNPADMLVARAGAKLARLVYADVVHGIYAREEVE